jgi:hypothetical protein
MWTPTRIVQLTLAETGCERHVVSLTLTEHFLCGYFPPLAGRCDTDPSSVVYAQDDERKGTLVYAGRSDHALAPALTQLQPTYPGAQEAGAAASICLLE